MSAGDGTTIEMSAPCPTKNSEGIQPDQKYMLCSVTLYPVRSFKKNELVFDIQTAFVLEPLPYERIILKNLMPFSHCKHMLFLRRVWRIFYAPHFFRGLLLIWSKKGVFARSNQLLINVL